MRKSAAWIALAAASAAMAAHAEPTCRTASAEVEGLIARKARELSMAEYCQFRRYDALDDVDGDGKGDFLVLFTLEGPDGANHHVSFLACFPSAGGAPALAQAGKRGERDPVDFEVEGRNIVVSTLEYRPNDPMCCPSGKGTRTYRLDNGRLTLASGR